MIILEAFAFMYYDENEGKFLTEKGTYQIYVGKSVEDVCCEEKIEIK